MKSSLLLILTSVVCLGAIAQVKDEEGRVYKTTEINSQKWMSENLNVSHFKNGDTIIQVLTDEEWLKATANHQPAWCYYENDPKNGEKYGKLYNWYAVSPKRSIVQTEK